MPTSFAELELTIHHLRDTTYHVGLKFTMPDSAAEIGHPADKLLEFTLDQKQLTTAPNIKAYSQWLSEAFFTHELAKAVSNQLAVASSKELPTRIRLDIGATATALHTVRWELLRSPLHSDQLLSTDERIWFSRYLGATTFERVDLINAAHCKVLACISNPPQLHSGIDTARELAIAKQAFAPFEVTFVPPVEGPTPISFRQLTDALKTIAPDILYLAAHGEWKNKTTTLIFEHPDKRLEPIDAAEVEQQIRRLTRRPTLALLSICNSLGNEDADQVLAALGPRLIGAGIPVVIAMLGNISAATMSEFLQTLVKELNEHGEIEHAVAQARNDVRKRLDMWTPILFTNLKSGLVFEVPTSTSTQETAEFQQQWQSLTEQYQAILSDLDTETDSERRRALTKRAERKLAERQSLESKS